MPECRWLSDLSAVRFFQRVRTHRLQCVGRSCSLRVTASDFDCTGRGAREAEVTRRYGSGRSPSRGRNPMDLGARNQGRARQEPVYNQRSDAYVGVVAGGRSAVRLLNAPPRKPRRGRCSVRRKPSSARTAKLGAPSRSRCRAAAVTSGASSPRFRTSLRGRLRARRSRTNSANRDPLVPKSVAAVLIYRA